MKKLLFVLLMTALVSATANAQNNERRGGNGGGGQMREMIKGRLASDLKISDANADSVLTIQFDYQRDVRMTERNSGLDEAQKATKLAELKGSRNEKLKTYINDEQIKKLDEMMENMRKMREQRQGQGQGFPRD